MLACVSDCELVFLFRGKCAFSTKNLIQATQVGPWGIDRQTFRVLIHGFKCVVDQLQVNDRNIDWPTINLSCCCMCIYAQVNDEWILRRLERWGRQDDMPFVGPKKGAILSSLVRNKQPLLAVEVGTMAGGWHGIKHQHRRVEAPHQFPLMFEDHKKEV